MKNILAIGASSSKNSINRTLANYVANQISEAKVDLLDLNDYEMPLYSIDKEKRGEVPALIHEFKQKISESDAIVLSLAEHNGSYASVFKNIIDWGSRLEGKLWETTPIFLLSTSPGARGGKTVFEAFASYWGFNGANIAARLVFPEFYKNFDAEQGIVNESLKTDFTAQLAALEQAIAQGVGTGA